MKVAVVGLCVLTLAGCGGGESKPLIAHGKVAAVRGVLTPNVHLFAEPVVAQIDVFVNRTEVDPRDVRVKTDFQPYETLGKTRVTRQDIGNFTHIRYATTLRCLGVDCVPRTASGETTVSQTPAGLPVFQAGQQRGEVRVYRFPAAIVSVATGSKTKILGRVVWSPLRSLSRINWSDSSVVGQGFPFVSNVAPLPEPDYRIAPALLGAGLLVLALVLFGIPVWLVVRRRRSREAPGSDAGPRLSPLEHALALVEWAGKQPSVDDRREALEALAFELESRDGDERADRAREQGWSRPAPTPEEMTALVSSIREDHAPAS